MPQSTVTLGVRVDPAKPGVERFCFFSGEAAGADCDARGNVSLDLNDHRVAFRPHRLRGTTPMMRFVGLHLWPRGTSCDTERAHQGGRPRYRPLGGAWEEAPFAVEVADGRLFVTPHREAAGSWEYTLVVECHGKTYSDVAQSVLTIREPLPAALEAEQDIATVAMARVA